MEHTFKVHILAAERLFYEGACESIIIPAVDGQYGIMANHSNMISAVVPGILTYRTPGEKAKIASVSSGIVKIENNDVLILVDTIERPEEIDINRAERESREARTLLQQKKSLKEYKLTQANLARASWRLKARKSYEIDVPDDL